MVAQQLPDTLRRPCIFPLTPVHLSGLSPSTAVPPPVWISVCVCFLSDYESTRWPSVPLHRWIWVKVSTCTAHACTDRSLIFPAHLLCAVLSPPENIWWIKMLFFFHDQWREVLPSIISYRKTIWRAEPSLAFVANLLKWIIRWK